MLEWENAVHVSMYGAFSFLAALTAYFSWIFFFVKFVNFTHRVISKLGISCCLEDSTAYLMNFSANAVPSVQ